MIVSIQQPEHLPWIGFFNKMAQSDLYVYLDNVQYKKRYFENRNKILTKDGEKWVTVPVETKNKFQQRICEVQIENEAGWKRKYLGTLEHAYRKSRYWSDVKEIIFPVIENNHEFLLSLNLALIENIRDYLGIGTKTVLASSLGVDQFAGSDIILAISRITGANVYISGPDGKNYLKLNEFDLAGIKVVYHEFVHPRYLQASGQFLSHMSVIDLIANCGKDSVSIVRECYKNDFKG